MANKTYISEEVEKKTVNIIEDMFFGKGIKTHLSVNDKTPVIDGFIKYKGLDFAVQIKGSEASNNKEISHKYIEYSNQHRLIYFYCINVFDCPKVYYKIFTPEEFKDSSLYNNYKSYNYHIAFNKKASKGDARYIVFKEFDDIKTFTSELDYLYKNNLPTDVTEDVGELFGNIEPNGKEVEFSATIKMGANFGEYEIVSVSSVINENDKLIRKVVDGANVGIALGSNAVKRGILRSIIDKGEHEVNIEGKKFIVKFNADPIGGKGTLVIGEHKFILDKGWISEDEQNLHITGTASYNILSEDVDGLENFVLFFSQFLLVQEIKERFTKDLEISKNFNNWLESNQLDKTITNNMDNRQILYGVFVEEVKDNLRLVSLIDNIDILMIANRQTKKYVAIHTIDKLSLNVNNIEIDANYFLLIINLYMKRRLDLDILFKLQNIDFRQEIFNYGPIFQSNEALIGILILMAMHYYVYSKDEVIYDLLERSFLNNISEESCFLSYMQIKKHKGLKLSQTDENKIERLLKCQNIDTALVANILLGNNFEIKKLYNQLSDYGKIAFKNSPIFELVDKNILD